MNFSKYFILSVLMILIAGNAVAVAPVISSATDSPDPINAGASIGFSAIWSDADANTGKLFVCKTDSVTATAGCGGGEWCSSTGYDTTTPKTCNYTAQAPKGAKDYWAFICEETGTDCSATQAGVTNGSFTVNNSAPALSSIDINAAYAKNGAHLKATASGVSDADSDALDFVCSTTMANLVLGTYDFCTQTGITSANYSTVSCTTTAGTANETKNAYCKIKDSDTNSDVKTDSYIEDNAAPSPPIAPAVSAGNASVTVSGYTVSDAANYKIWRSTSSAFDSNTLVTTTTATTYNDTTVSNGSTYYYKISAIDAAGNESAPSPISAAATPSAAATAAPTISTLTSSTHSDGAWSNASTVTLSWTASGTVTAYKYCFSTSALCDPGTSTTSTTVPFSNQSDGNYAFRLKACNTDSNCSEIAQFNAKIDTVAPSVPTDFTGTSLSNGIKLTWTAPSDSSGIYRYKLYRSNTNDFTTTAGTTREVTVDGDENSYTDTYNLNSGQAYYYRIRAIDNAGNNGSITPAEGGNGRQVNFTGTPECSLSFSISPSEGFFKQGSQEITVSISGGTIENGRISVRKTGSTAETILSNQDNKTSMSKEHEFDSDGTYDLLVSGEDESGEDCDATATITIDSTNPEIEWIAPSASQITKTATELKATATDSGSGINSVEFYSKDGNAWTKLGEGTKNGDDYTFSWTPSAIGTIELKALAKDKSGNEKEATKTVIVSEAEGSAIYSKQWNYSESKLKQLLLDAGMNENYAGTTAETTNEATPKVMVKAVKNGELIDVIVEITFTNSSTEAKNLKAIVIIPKALAATASLITSDNSFEVIQEDPVLSFTFTGIGAGTSKKFSYFLAKGIEEADANALVDNAMAELTVPPAIVSSDTEAKKMFEKGFSTSWMMMGVITLIIVLLIAAIVLLVSGGYLFHRYKKKGGNMNSNTLSGAKGSGLSFKLKEFAEGKPKVEGSKEKKFSYKDY